MITINDITETHVEAYMKSKNRKITGNLIHRFNGGNSCWTDHTGIIAYDSLILRWLRRIDFETKDCDKSNLPAYFPMRGTAWYSLSEEEHQRLPIGTELKLDHEDLILVKQENQQWKAKYSQGETEHPPMFSVITYIPECDQIPGPSVDNDTYVPSKGIDLPDGLVDCSPSDNLK